MRRKLTIVLSLALLTAAMLSIPALASNTGCPADIIARLSDPTLDLSQGMTTDILGNELREKYNLPAGGKVMVYDPNNIPARENVTMSTSENPFMQDTGTRIIPRPADPNAFAPNPSVPDPGDLIIKPPTTDAPPPQPGL